MLTTATFLRTRTIGLCKYNYHSYTASQLLCDGVPSSRSAGYGWPSIQHVASLKSGKRANR